MLAYSPAYRYYSTSGTNAPGALGESSGLPDTEQDLTFTAPLGGYYLLVIANLGSLSAIPFALSVIVNGDPLFAGVTSTGDLTASNHGNFYPVRSPGRDLDRRGRQDHGRLEPGDALVHSLRGPTADSNDLATDRRAAWAAKA